MDEKQTLEPLALVGIGCRLPGGIRDVESFWNAVADLDFWLRSDGHRRNPGTTADLIAASLFVGIHNGTIEPPFR